MNYHSNTINCLPDEIDFFKNKIIKENDPIKKYMFNLNELTYILKRVSKISIPSTLYFKIYALNNKERLLELISYAYLNKDLSTNKDYMFVKDFIDTFFDCNKAVYGINSNYSVWIYPKDSIKNFVSNSVFEYEKDPIFYNKTTLNKVINIFTSFTKLEYSNCDQIISSLFKGLNYPTLVLANIDLYEKGYIKIRENFNKIQFSLNKSKQNNKNSILFKNRTLLKKEILNFINHQEDTKYYLNDFL